MSTKYMRSLGRQNIGGALGERWPGEEAFLEFHSAFFPYTPSIRGVVCFSKLENGEVASVGGQVARKGERGHGSPCAIKQVPRKRRNLV